MIEVRRRPWTRVYAVTGTWPGELVVYRVGSTGYRMRLGIVAADGGVDVSAAPYRLPPGDARRIAAAVREDLGEPGTPAP